MKAGMSARFQAAAWAAMAAVMAALSSEPVLSSWAVWARRGAAAAKAVIRPPASRIMGRTELRLRRGSMGKPPQSGLRISLQWLHVRSHFPVNRFFPGFFSFSRGAYGVFAGLPRLVRREGDGERQI